MNEQAWYWRIGIGVEATTWEDAVELTRQARLAEKQEWTQNTHGVSATTRATSGSAKASRSAVEAHFRVVNTPTLMNPEHKTIELPKPITEEVATVFNRLFGRSPEPS